MARNQSKPVLCLRRHSGLVKLRSKGVFVVKVCKKQEVTIRDKPISVTAFDSWILYWIEADSHLSCSHLFKCLQFSKLEPCIPVIEIAGLVQWPLTIICLSLWNAVILWCQVSKWPASLHLSSIMWEYNALRTCLIMHDTGYVMWSQLLFSVAVTDSNWTASAGKSASLWTPWHWTRPSAEAHICRVINEIVIYV